jgi:hypothetical protein
VLTAQRRDVADPKAVMREGPLGEQDMIRVTVEGKAGRCTPVCNDIFPLPFGYWLSDYFVVGYALPVPYLFPEPPSVRCDERGIEVRSHNAMAGRLSMWLDRWTPLHAKDDGDTRCGILTEVAKPNSSSIRPGLEPRARSTGNFRAWNGTIFAEPFAATTDVR